MKILGLLEARLLSCDIALLGGLNETVWPIQPQSDMFLSRPMREALGLPLPERRIGQSAHDFVAALGNAEVILSFAQKRDGTPQVASRFLQRIKACTGDAVFETMKARGQTYLDLARALDAPTQSARGALPNKIKRPEPRPALALRPKSLSVTRIETLRRDPYALYAEKILKLKPLGSLDGHFDARLKGILWHEIFEWCASTLVAPQLAAPVADFAQSFQKKAQDKALEIFSEALENPKFAFVLWQQFETALRFYCAYELQLLQQTPRLIKLQTECTGVLHIDLNASAIMQTTDMDKKNTFTLTAKADRIELFEDDSARILDFKTGALPTKKAILAGFAPQLTLEIAMLRHGAFGFIPTQNNFLNAAYIKIGGKDGGEFYPLDDGEELANTHFQNCISLLRSYNNEATPYRARPFIDFALRYNVFDHLARTKEWSDTGGLNASVEETFAQEEA